MPHKSPARTYNANGGTGSVPTDSNKYFAGQSATVLFSPVPTRTNYTLGSDGNEIMTEYVEEPRW
jgi:hypothetical protein